MYTLLTHKQNKKENTTGDMAGVGNRERPDQQSEIFEGVNLKDLIIVLAVFTLSCVFIITSNNKSDQRKYILIICSVFGIACILLYWSNKKASVHSQASIELMLYIIIPNYLLFFIYYKLDIQDYPKPTFMYFVLKAFEYIWETELFDFGRKISVIMIMYFVISICLFIFLLMWVYSLKWWLAPILALIYFLVMYKFW